MLAEQEEADADGAPPEEEDDDEDAYMWAALRGGGCACLPCFRCILLHLLHCLLLHVACERPRRTHAGMHASLHATPAAAAASPPRRLSGPPPPTTPRSYNPLKLPLGWDGKPIPYWLYKLHGLNMEFKCEICGNYR